jgi:hypothetical protein
MSGKHSPPRFGRSRRSRARRAGRRGLLGWWLLWRVPALALIVMAAWWFLFRPIAQEQGWVRIDASFALCGEGARAAGCVIDGDTVVLADGEARRRIRFTGFDAPELEGECEAERVLARAARSRLHLWLAEGAFEWNGADDPPRDRYGRELRAARRIGPEGEREYLAATMIASGLAAAPEWGQPPRDWCAQGS